MKGRVPYSGPGHISIAYVVGQHKKQTEEIVKIHAQKFLSSEFSVDHVVVKFGEETHNVQLRCDDSATQATKKNVILNKKK